MLDRYRIECELGAGGMGRVFRAFDTRLHRHIALKVLLNPEEAQAAVGAEGQATLPAGSAWAEAVERLLREARAVAALNHPNVVAVYDVGEALGVPYIAMEFVAGTSLASYVGDRAIPWQERLRWVAETARALGAAHRAGIVHRDVKPANVILREDGAVKVLDFGIARLSSTMASAAGTGEGFISGERPLGSFEPATTSPKIMGTPQYMAPEQIRGDPLDGRTDQFAWGVMAYELLGGRSPWEASTPLSAIGKILSREPQSVRALAPELPAEVEAAVHRALRKEPADRFATMEELLAILEPFLPDARAPGGAHPTGRHSAHALELSTIPAPPPDPSGDTVAVQDLQHLSLPETSPIPELQGRSMELPDVPAPGQSLPEQRASNPEQRRASDPAPRTSDPAPRTSDPEPPARATNTLDERPTDPEPSRRPSRAPRRSAAAAIVGALGLAVALVALFFGRDRAEAPQAPAAPPAPARVSLADLPPPVGCAPGATATYQDGMRLMREGNYDQAARRFAEAATADSGCAAALMRTAISGRYFLPPPGVHAAYQRALQLRSALTERDQALLHTYEPILLREPPDRDELSARLLEVVARFPGDAEMLMLAAAESRASLEERIDFARRSADIDPQYSDAWQNLGKLLALAGREAEALEAIASCLKASPLSTDCLWQRMAMHRGAGRCKLMEEDARAVIQRSPETAAGYATLAAALAAQHTPPEAVTMVLQKRWILLPDVEREQERLLDEAAAAAYAGAFDDAEARARQLLARLPGDAGRTERVRPLRLLLEAHLETGRAAETQPIMKDFVVRLRAWGLRDSITGSIFADHVYDEPRLLAVAHELGALGAAQRREEIARWREEAQRSSDKLDVPSLWAMSEALPARDAAEAERALAGFPGGLPAPGQGPARFRVAGFPAVFTGRALLLAGRAAEAEAYLKQGAAACTALDDPFLHTRAYLWLGEARQQTGDRDAACAAYGVVIRRWGQARPASVSAREARRRMKALRCGDGGDVK